MSNSVANIGVGHRMKIDSRRKWLFRPQPVNDIGIDAHMEFADEIGRSRQLLALQIKTGSSYFSELKDDCYVFRDMNERQYIYWTKNPLPCVLILYNPENDMCIWQKLTIKTIEKNKGGEGKGFTVKVPINQVFLDDASDVKLLNFSNLPEYIYKLQFPVISETVYENH